MAKFLLLLLVMLFFNASSSFAQTLSTITPNSVVAGQTVDITIRGLNTHFQNNISGITFSDPSISLVKPLVVRNTVTAIATVKVKNSATPGPVNVIITTRKESASIPAGIIIYPTTGILRADIEVLAMESISLKNIDLSNPQKTPVLFQATIFNNSSPRTVKLLISVFNSKDSLGYMAKYWIQLSKNGNATYTNNQFNSVKFNGTTGGSPGGDFLNTVELTGAFPADNYTYKLYVIDSLTGSTIATATTTTTLTNPINNPTLITPGNAMPLPATTEYIPLPLFQWFGQNNRYDFSLYECRPGQSPEETVRNVAVYKQNDVSGNSLLYPNSAEKLIDGKNYAWQVNGKMISASGTQYYPSEVFWFTYHDLNTIGKPVVTSITITPEEITLVQGQQYQFKVTCYDQNGTIMADTTTLLWSVTPNQGTVTPKGLFTAGQGGNTVAVLVSAGLATEFATVTISLTSRAESSIFSMGGFIHTVFGLK